MNLDTLSKRLDGISFNENASIGIDALTEKISVLCKPTAPRYLEEEVRTRHWVYHFTIKVKKGQVSMDYKAEKDACFQQAVYLFCDEIGVYPCSVEFFYQGRRIYEGSMLKDLGVEQYGVIEAHLKE